MVLPKGESLGLKLQEEPLQTQVSAPELCPGWSCAIEMLRSGRRQEVLQIRSAFCAGLCLTPTGVPVSPICTGVATSIAEYRLPVRTAVGRMLTGRNTAVSPRDRLVKSCRHQPIACPPTPQMTWTQSVKLTQRRLRGLMQHPFFCRRLYSATPLKRGCGVKYVRQAHGQRTAAASKQSSRINGHVRAGLHHEGKEVVGAAGQRSRPRRTKSPGQRAGRGCRGPMAS